MTDIYEQGLRRMTKLVNSLLARSDIAPFSEPVDWRGLELYDYPKVIKKMMDLGTVKRKLERNQYKTAKECADDIRLIWINCQTYNADGSDFYLLAEGFSKRFEERYKKIQSEFDTGDNDGKSSSKNEKGVLSLEVKTKFASTIFRLSGLELGHVLQVLDLRCPNALEDPEYGGGSMGEKGREEGTGVEINVDAIDARTFAELDRYVKEKMALRSHGSAENSSGSSGGQVKTTTTNSTAAAAATSSSSSNGGGSQESGKKRKGKQSFERKVQAKT